jgi:predicted HicB family RNase H-like nuclease
MFFTSRKESDAVAEMIQRRSTQFNMRMDPVLKAAAEKAAAADRRSLSSLVEKLLETYCRETGHLEPHGGRPGRKGRRS